MDSEEEWTCSNCGSGDPHHAMELPAPDDERFEDLDMVPEPEVEIDVTCHSVYFTPIDGGHGFGFTHEEFEKIIEHYRNR